MQRKSHALNVCLSKRLRIYSKCLVVLFVTQLSFGVAAHAQSLAEEKNTILPAHVYDRLFFEKNDYGVREGARTDGVIVWQNGKNIYERYEREYNPQNKHIMWSVSKTITALLFGVAINEKLVNLDQSICDFVKTQDPKKCAITVRHVLTWSTALYWREDYENTSELSQSSVIAMLYGEGTFDMAQFVIDQPLLSDARPGEVWRYSSGDTLLAAKILEQVYKGQNLREVFNKKLFAPLGITNWACESDEKGVLGGAFYFYLTLPDMIKVGELILGRGTYRGQKLMSEDFIKFMSTVPDAYKKRRLDMKDPVVSGAHLWLNDPQGSAMPKPWPEAPLDTVVAMGHWGQYVVVIPSLNLIAARVGDTRDGSVRIFSFIKNLMEPLAPPPKVTVIQPSVKKIGPREKALITYRDGRIRLGLAFTAKDFCSCLFVAQRPEARCRDYASLKQISPMLSVDYKSKKTKSSWFYLLSREAQYFESEKGCRLLH